MSRRSGGAPPWAPRTISRKSFKGQIDEDTDTLGRVPEIARRIGQIVACWASVEIRLIELFAYVVDAEEWVAAELLERIHKFDIRRGLLRGPIRQKMGEQAEAVALQLFDDLWDVQKFRDDLAHGRFRIINGKIGAETFTNAVIRIRGWGKKEQWELYEVAMLDALLGELMRCSQIAANLFMNATVLTPPRYEAGRLIPAWTLGSHPQHLPPGSETLGTPPQHQNDQTPNAPGALPPKEGA